MPAVVVATAAAVTLARARVDNARAVKLARARVDNARAVSLRVDDALVATRSMARSTARNVDTPDATDATKFNFVF